MIFIDSNVPMYLVGAAHPHKVDAQRRLEEVVARGDRLVTDAEVFHEILHRYAAIHRRDAIQVAFDALLGVVDEVFPIELVDAERAKGVVLERSTLSARDAIHVAVMERRRVSQILSFDSGFDQIPGMVRLA